MGKSTKSVCTKHIKAIIIAVTNTVICLPAFILYIRPAIILPDLNRISKLFYIVMAISFLLRYLSGCGLIYGIIKKKKIFITCWIVLTWCHGVILLSCSIVGLIYTIVNDTIETYKTFSAIYTIFGIFLIDSARRMTAYVNTLPKTQQQRRSAQKDVENMLMREEVDNNNEESVQQGDDAIPMNNVQHISNSIPAEAA